MRLSKEAIEEFKDIYYKKFGEKNSDAKAQELGERLLLLFKAVYYPFPEDDKQDKNGKSALNQPSKQDKNGKSALNQPSN